MHEEIEYAEMLEIPVSTVNVVKKPARRRKKTTENTQRPAESTPLKDSVIAQVNDKLKEEPLQREISADADLFAESANSAGTLDFDPIPDRIDTVRLYSEDAKRSFRDRHRLRAQEYDFSEDTSSMEYEEEYEEEPSRPIQIALKAEFIAACALCGAIFLTNVFMPHSAINTFFRSLNGTQVSTTDERAYTDFQLSPVVSELSNAELNLSPTGVLSFTEKGCVYAAADGEVVDVSMDSNGVYRIKIAHSDTFTGIIGGLDYVYYTVGEEVKSNVPVGYSDGENEVQVTMYSNGVLLNCFQLTQENCLAWIEQNE